MIESIRVIDEKQRVARVRVGRSELVTTGDFLPHFEGKRYRALGGMCLIDGVDGEWIKGEHGDTRLIEVVVVPEGAWPNGYAERARMKKKRR